MKSIITENESGQRVDRFLRKRYRDYPDVRLSDIYAWIRKGACRINGKKVAENYRLHSGDELTRHPAGTEASPLETRKNKQEKIRSFSLDRIKPLILFEDDARIVWNKPAGIVTHPGTNHQTDMSLHDIMQSYLQQTGQKSLSPTFHPAFCFRLDKDTSGVIISAKTYESLQWLNQQIRERKTTKRYLTIVGGHAPRHLEMNQSLHKGYDKQFGVAKMYIQKEGKQSRTVAHCQKHYVHDILGAISLLEVELHTGRMHQIRSHLSHAGYPIIGDLMYGNAVLNRLAKRVSITRQLLHAQAYGFFDPFQNSQVSYTAPVPQDFRILFPDV